MLPQLVTACHQVKWARGSTGIVWQQQGCSEGRTYSTSMEIFVSQVVAPSQVCTNLLLVTGRLGVLLCVMSVFLQTTLLYMQVAKHTPELAQLVVGAGGVGALVDYVAATKGNTRLPGIMALGYIAAFSETLGLAVIAEKGLVRSLTLAVCSCAYVAAWPVSTEDTMSTAEVVVEMLHAFLCQ